MKRTSIGMLLAVGALTAGCRGPEIVISNPLSSGNVEPNKIEHKAKWAEGTSGLPPGTLTDEASLEKVDDKSICFAVTTRVPNEATLDLRSATAELEVKSGGSSANPSVVATEPTTKTFHGRVPQQTVVGAEHKCINVDPNTGACRTWDDQPKYGTIYVPGDVEVREQSAKICFPNKGTMMPVSEGVTLDIKQDGHRAERFRWGFGPKQ